ncbi:J domain-containing protein [Aneurinibacillus aneurinilyticus]|jgi:DnaJ-class molecular chaperone|uniref:J domain-containing protein n=2 Tax=Aneurinibacillus aneurinilyticus TaxID=1391 RepID=A0A848CVS6_ANEAE|nr:DnaJ domain-containing protein [Aneurinibacillus aneurinilyticus]ERI04669.1 DnaJ domain protein [Aneurinibacillus aneurinilyticus ATCC 12856]MED0706035.1 DnaJ domain-containing protein [Aneurinibacillus aneurinilyticus]MED0724866.1 DnaJ domain-containing protein [Aneurinibacillus aneurinilyticus]MED0730841.1 DnaJ domain-containing protein [Aneurinibacillus aneurinilyticus]MED0743618.1 DnaJ domain-containing protein [Aneurinibacillus aneurinilyticus]
MKNYYAILGVEKGASQEEIKKVYRKLAKKYHPDVNAGSSESERIFKDISEAYRTLSDESLRKKYDAQMNNTGEAASGAKNQADTNTRTHSAQESYQGFDMRNMEKNFERFFGFNPKTKEMANREKDKSKNPMDTTDLFESYFRTKKRSQGK